MLFDSFLTIISDFCLMVFATINSYLLACFSMNIFLDLTVGHILIVVIVVCVVYSIIFGGDNG